MVNILNGNDLLRNSVEVVDEGAVSRRAEKQHIVFSTERTVLHIHRYSVCGLVLISECDVVISVNNNDERNLLCSLLVKQLGVKRVIARVAKVLNIPLFEKVGIDIAVSPKTSAINEVRNDINEAEVDILATVEQGQAEVLEITIKDNFDKNIIKDLQFPAPAIVGVIQRKNHVIIPKGDTQIEKNDILIIFTMAQNAEKIKEYFRTV